LPHYRVKNNKFDCRIVDHTHTIHQPALIRATHLLLGKNIVLRLTEHCRQYTHLHCS